MENNFTYTDKLPKYLSILRYNLLFSHYSVNWRLKSLLIILYFNSKQI